MILYSVWGGKWICWKSKIKSKKYICQAETHLSVQKLYPTKSQLSCCPPKKEIQEKTKPIWTFFFGDRNLTEYTSKYSYLSLSENARYFIKVQNQNRPHSLEIEKHSHWRR